MTAQIDTMGVDGALTRLHRALDRLCVAHNNPDARHAVPIVFLGLVAHELEQLVDELREAKRELAALEVSS